MNSQSDNCDFNWISFCHFRLSLTHSFISHLLKHFRDVGKKFHLTLVEKTLFHPASHKSQRQQLHILMDRNWWWWSHIYNTHNNTSHPTRRKIWSFFFVKLRENLCDCLMPAWVESSSQQKSSFCHIQMYSILFYMGIIWIWHHECLQ